MKNLFKVLAIIALVIMVGFTLIGCSDGGSSVVGNVGTTIDIAAIDGVIMPEIGETPVTTITENEQYTGTIKWNGNPVTFEPRTVYTATITLTAKAGFKFIGVEENFFNVLGAETTTNAANSNIVTAVFPETSGTQAQELVAEWYTTQAGANEKSEYVHYEFKEDGKILKNGSDDNFVYEVDGNTITVTYTADSSTDTAEFLVYGTTLTITNATGTLLTNGIYFMHTNAGTAIGGGDSDFTLGTLVTAYNVHNTMQWEAARAAISTGGKDRNYIINIIGDVTISGANSYYTGNPPTKSYDTFNPDGVSVSIRGTGKLGVDESYGKDGALLTIRAGQKLMLHGVTLQGHSTNNDSLIVTGKDTAVTPSYGTFIMYSGLITGNSTNETDKYGNGGGVRNEGMFIMLGGEISDNTARNGGGVYSTGTFRMVDGTIYGLGASDKENFSISSGYSLYGSVQLGTFTDSDFTEGTAISTTNFTIHAVNGVIPGINENITGSWWTSSAGAGTPKYNFSATGGITIDGEDSCYYYSASGNIITFTNAYLDASSTSTFVITNRYTLTFSGNTGGSAAFADGSVYRPDPSIPLHYEWLQYEGSNRADSVAFRFRNDGKVVYSSSEFDYSVSGNTITVPGYGTAQFAISGAYLNISNSTISFIYSGHYYRTASSSLTNSTGWFDSVGAAYIGGSYVKFRFDSNRMYVGSGSSDYYNYTQSGSTITLRNQSDNSVKGTFNYSISNQVMTVTNNDTYLFGNGKFYGR